MSPNFRPIDSIISLIEAPEIYIFARSNSSTKDQMLYTPYRVEDIKSLIPSISPSGIIYRSTMKVGIGKIIPKTNYALIPYIYFHKKVSKLLAFLQK